MDVALAVLILVNVICPKSTGESVVVCRERQDHRGGELMLTRRQAFATTLAAAFARGAWSAESPSRALKRIKERIGGRLGVDVLDSQSGRRFGIDEDSRYAMAS